MLVAGRPGIAEANGSGSERRQGRAAGGRRRGRGAAQTAGGDGDVDPPQPPTTLQCAHAYESPE